MGLYPILFKMFSSFSSLSYLEELAITLPMLAHNKATKGKKPAKIPAYPPLFMYSPVLRGVVIRVKLASTSY